MNENDIAKSESLARFHNELIMSRYLFEQARRIYPALQSHVPAFGDAIALMNYSFETFRKATPFVSTEERSSLLHLLCLHSVQEICRVEPNFNCRSIMDSNPVEALISFNSEKLSSISDELLEQTSSSQKRTSEAACKLLLHLSEPEWLEKIEINSLDFVEEPVGESILRKLKYLRRLEYLNLSHTYFPAEALQNLVHLPLLRELVLSDTRTSNNGLALLKNSPSIEILDIKNTLVTNAAYESIRKVARLQCLKCDEHTFSSTNLNSLNAAGVKIEH